jgi:hypothetical protein
MADAAPANAELNRDRQCRHAQIHNGDPLRPPQDSQVSGVGEFVEVDQRIGRICCQLLKDKVGPDKSRTAADYDDILHASSVSLPCE